MLILCRTSCCSLPQHKGSVTSPASILEYPIPNGPMDVIGIDLLKLLSSHQGSTHVLTCVDHFSCFVILAPLPDKSADIVVHALVVVTHVFCPFTTPCVILSDNNTEFKNLHTNNMSLVGHKINLHHLISSSIKRSDRKN